MKNVRQVKEDLYFIGVNDRRIELFENIYPVENGVSYNSYVLLDEKNVLFDTVDKTAGEDFIENLTAVLDGKNLDYIVVNLSLIHIFISSFLAFLLSSFLGITNITFHYTVICSYSEIIIYFSFYTVK